MRMSAYVNSSAILAKSSSLLAGPIPRTPKTRRVTAREHSQTIRAAPIFFVVQDLTARRESQRGLSVQHLVSQGTITVSWRVNGNNVVIEVADTGIGIDATQLERIFDPFVQVQSGTTRTSEGVGLGLAISRDMARQMGGDITVRSKSGKGSTFSLLLPRGA